MLIHIRSQATTKPKVRAEIQASDEPARGVPVGEQRLEFGLVVRAQVQADVIASHAPTLTLPAAAYNLPSGAEH